MVSIFLLALVAGSLVYCALTVIAAARYADARPAKPGALPPISILKPLSGVDLGLEDNLRTFFQQKYPEYEILFAVRSPEDPAIAVVERVRAAFPGGAVAPDRDRRAAVSQCQGLQPRPHAGRGPSRSAGHGG